MRSPSPLPASPAAVTIAIHPLAPPKPAWGQPCNGCGVCCLSEPCPVGMLISRRRRGACDALVWDAPGARYRCGLLVDAAAQLPAPLRPVAPLVQRWARRVIAAGIGCDCDTEVVVDGAGPVEGERDAT
jgi:hypothetical protein